MPPQSDISDDVLNILSVYGTDELGEFLKIAWELISLYNIDDYEDWVRDEVGDDNVLEVRLARTAYLLSKIADEHGPLLKKIQRRCPKFWRKAEIYANRS